MNRAEVKLSPDGIKALVMRHYGLPIHSIEQVRAVYKVTTPYGVFGFKNAEELPDLPVIAAYLQRIRLNGFGRTPKILPTNEGHYLLRHLDQFYFLEEWLPLAEVPKESLPYLANIGRTLADFHYAAKGIVPAPESHRFEWGRRRPFSLAALSKIREWKQQPQKDAREQRILDFLYYRCYLALDYIRAVSSDELLRTCPDAAVLCHGGLHHKNILVDRHHTIWFIDFETMLYAERVMDLAQLLQYHAAPYGWNPAVVNTFLMSYMSRLEMPLCPAEWSIFMSYLAFPRRFYNRMIRYFDNSERPQEFLLKLVETVDEDSAKDKFLTMKSFGS